MKKELYFVEEDRKDLTQVAVASVRTLTQEAKKSLKKVLVHKQPSDSHTSTN